MGFLDKLLGREPATPQGQSYPQQYQPAYDQQGQQGQQGQQDRSAAGPQDSTTGATAADRQAIARYRYLLRTAPPEQIEEAHAQAFSQLSPSQRQQVLQEMTQSLPAGEQPQSDDPRQLARAATRAEMQQPGYLQRTFGGRGYAGGGMMGAMGGSLLGTIAGVVIGTAVADSLMGGFDGSPEQQDVAGDGADGSGDGGSGDAGSGDAGSGDSGTDAGGGTDQAGFDSAGSGDGGWGGDSGGGDYGGGDFGGGDFGGGDFGGGF